MIYSWLRNAVALQDFGVNVYNPAVQGKQLSQKQWHTNKAVAPLLLQHLADVTNTTDGELIVVELVARCSSCIHDIIALLLLVLAFGFSWGALRSRVMLAERKKKRKKGQSEQSLINFFSPNINVAHLSNSPGSQSCVLLHVQKWYERLLEVRGRRSSVRWLYQCWETSFFRLSTACFFHRCLQSSLRRKSTSWNKRFRALLHNSFKCYSVHDDYSNNIQMT